jgi:hypothetical protein
MQSPAPADPAAPPTPEPPTLPPLPAVLPPVPAALPPVPVVPPLAPADPPATEPAPPAAPLEPLSARSSARPHPATARKPRIVTRRRRRRCKGTHHVHAAPDTLQSVFSRWECVAAQYNRAHASDFTLSQWYGCLVRSVGPLCVLVVLGRASRQLGPNWPPSRGHRSSGDDPRGQRSSDGRRDRSPSVPLAEDAQEWGPVESGLRSWAPTASAGSFRHCDPSAIRMLGSAAISR